MNITQLINKKKHGFELSEDEIKWVINSYTNGDIEDYHMSAFCMAVYFMGMTDTETTSFTFAMAQSGDTIDLSCFGDLSADKHSTGGVGDKTSLIIAPIVASLGGIIAKMSGRGLGHTGGTIDKLESISGYNTSLTESEFINIAKECGIALTGATKKIAPADKKLYALRDVTATVDSIPLIASSVMSKKIASGAKNIVLDVKCGSGAFMKTLDDAKQLAAKAVAIGKMCNRSIAAVITDMDTPLGRNIGNSLEVIEALDVLTGKGPDDLKEVSFRLSSELLTLIFGGNWDDKVRESVYSGQALNAFKRWISLQGGDLSSIYNKSEYIIEVRSKKSGYISKMNSEKIGEAAMLLGAGRVRITDEINPTAGIELIKKTGDYINLDEILAVFHTNKKDIIALAAELFYDSLEFSDIKQAKKPIIYEVIR